MGCRDKQPKATFLMAQRQPSSHGFPETDSQRRRFSWLNASQAFMGFPRQTAKGDVSHGLMPAKLSWVAETNSQRRRFSWLNASQALMGFPRQTAKGVVSHGSTPAKLSWVSREKQPKATFLMAQRQAELSWFS